MLERGKELPEEGWLMGEREGGRRRKEKKSGRERRKKRQEGKTPALPRHQHL